MSTGTLDIRSKEAERGVAIIIHGFTIAHSLVALVAGPAAGPILTPMTATMIIAIGTQCSAGFCTKNALKLMSNFVGFLLGVGIAQAIIGLIPGVGNLANALASGVTTQILGWATYLMLRDNMDKRNNLGFFDKVSLLKAAVKKFLDNKEFMDELKKVRSKMSYEDRELYDQCMKTLTDKNSTQEQRQNALNKGKKILASYKFVF